MHCNVAIAATVFLGHHSLSNGSESICISADTQYRLTGAALSHLYECFAMSLFRLSMRSSVMPVWLRGGRCSPDSHEKQVSVFIAASVQMAIRHDRAAYQSRHS